MGLLTRDEILGKQDIKVQRVEIPEWDGHAFVRMLPGAERDRFEQSNVKVVKGKRGKTHTEPNPANFRARLAALCLCDEAGKRLFADSDAVDLGRKCGAALDRIADAALELNRMREEDYEEAEGNSESGPN